MITDNPNPALALACALVPIITCIAAGSAVAPGPRRLPGADMLVGFGLLTGALSVLAVTTRIPLSWIMTALAMLSGIVVLVQRQFHFRSSTWIALALVSPILLRAASHEPAAWDDFWNWLPSAAYEYYRNSLPWPDLPPSLSIFPGYPQSMPLMIAAASLIGARFLEAAGPIINVSLLAGSSALFAEALAAALARRGRLRAPEMPLVLIAIAVFITMLLNPGLDSGVVLSSYADSGMMVAIGALGLLGIEILARLSAQDHADADKLAWRFGFVGAMLVNLKQDGAILLALVMAGLTLIVLRDPMIRKQRVLLQLPRMLVPGIVVFAVWRWYVAQSSVGEQSFRAFNTWNLDVLPSTFVSIGNYVSKTPLFHSLMWIVTMAGVVFFVQLSRKTSEVRWLAVLCATVWFGYNAFLLIVYLGAMTRGDAAGAIDYWRYTPHVALLGLYTLTMALVVTYWPAASISPRSAVATVVAVIAAICILPMRDELNNNTDMPWQRFIREVVADMRSMIPAKSKVGILSFDFPKSRPFGVAVRYNLWQLDLPEQQIATTIYWNDLNLATILGRATLGDANFLIVQDADGSMDMATDALGLPRLDHQLVLFVWRDGSWEQMKSWSIPPAFIHSH